MSKFKIGDMALVEVKIVGEDTLINEYQLKLIKNAWTFWSDKDRVHPIIAKDTNIQNKTYEDGLNEAWEMAKKINIDDDNGGFAIDEIVEIFGTGNVDRILKENTPQEALTKIKEWEDRKEIHVGDVVTDYEDNPAVVIRKYYDNRTCMVMYGDFLTEEKEIEALSKTGKTICLNSLLSKIGGD